MSVVFDFRVGATSYRVTRRSQRRGAGNTQLEELGADGRRPPAKMRERARSTRKSAASLALHTMPSRRAVAACRRANSKGF